MTREKQRYCGECVKYPYCRRRGWPVERQDRACKPEPDDPLAITGFLKHHPRDACRVCQVHDFSNTHMKIACDHGGHVCLKCCIACNVRGCPRRELHDIGWTYSGMFALAVMRWKGSITTDQLDRLLELTRKDEVRDDAEPYPNQPA